MQRLKLIAALALSVALTGCSLFEPRTETVYVEPDCTAPPLPALDPPAWEDLIMPFHHIPSSHPDWRTFDDALDKLERYEARLTDSLIEHRSMLQALCQGEPT